MDDSRFDAFTRRLGRSASRRDALKALLGIGGVATIGAIALDDVDAARRGSSQPTVTPANPTATPTSPPPAPTNPPASGGRRPTQTAPTIPTCPGVVCADGCCDGTCTSTGACCPAGSTVCGPACCPNGTTQCCDNACCQGTCYGEELCCPTGRPVCTVDGCCDGVCTNAGQYCCSPSAACGDDCCDLATERCCTNDQGIAACIPSAGCCKDSDCTDAICQNGICVPFTPASTPTKTATSPPTETPANTATPTDTATATPTDTATATPIDTATSTPTDTARATPTNSATVTPTDTATSSPTDTATTTPTNTPTNTPTASATQYTGVISSATSGLSGSDCVVSATASGFAALAPIEFSLWGEGGPAPDGQIAIIPTTTDGTGSASIQYTVDQHAHSIVSITATQPLSSAIYNLGLNCPDPTPVPPDVTITFRPHPDEPDFCEATISFTNFSPNTFYSFDLLLLNGAITNGDGILTDPTGAGAYIVPYIVTADGDENIEVRVHVGSGTISSGVVPISC